MKVLRFLDKHFEESICCLLLGYIAISLNVEVVLRYVFNSPTAYTDEIARTMMIYIVFIGVPWAVRLDRHVIIDVFSESCSPMIKLFLKVFSKIIFIAFCVTFSYQAYRAVEFHHMLGSLTEGLELPYWAMLSVLPLSFGLTMIRLIQSINKAFKEYSKSTSCLNVVKVTGE